MNPSPKQKVRKVKAQTVKKGWAVIYIPTGEIQTHIVSDKTLRAEAMIGFSKQDKEDYEIWCLATAKTSFNGTQWKVIPISLSYLQ